MRYYDSYLFPKIYKNYLLNKLILLVTLQFTAICLLYAQPTVIKGKVFYQNSACTPAGGVGVYCNGTDTVLSNQLGIFELTLPDKKVGDYIFIEIDSIHQDGTILEVSNLNELYGYQIPPDTQRTLKIVVAASTVIDSLTEKYQTLLTNLIQHFETDLQAIMDSLQEVGLSAKLEDNLIKRYFKLQSKKKEATWEITHAAKLIARVNLGAVPQNFKTVLKALEENVVFDTIMQMLKGFQVSDSILSQTHLQDKGYALIQKIIANAYMMKNI